MPKPKTKKSIADTTGTSAKGGTVELPKGNRPVLGVLSGAAVGVPTAAHAETRCRRVAAVGGGVRRQHRDAGVLLRGA